MRHRGTLYGLIALTVFIVAVQLVTTMLDCEYYLTQLIMAAYYTTVVLGLCLLMGYAGQISLGHGAFFAIGGYTSAVLAKGGPLVSASGGATFWGRLHASTLGTTLQRMGALATRQDLYGDELFGVAPWLAFLCAMALTFLVAVFIGYPTLRLKGHYLAMGTLGFGLIVYRLVLGTEFLGSADGITSVPAWTLIPELRFGGESAVIPALLVTGKRSWRVQNYYIAWGLTTLVLVFALNIVHSRSGRALRAIHGDETAANAMGINTAGYKLKVFVISALLAAIAGCFLTHYNGGIGPAEGGVMRSVRYVTLVAAGGMANVWGAVVVGTLLTFLSLRGCFGSLDDAVFGTILILIMSLAPGGPLKPIGKFAIKAMKTILRLIGARRAGAGGTGTAHATSGG